MPCQSCKHFDPQPQIGKPRGSIGRCQNPKVGRWLYDLKARNCDGFGYEPKTVESMGHA